jgi:hypothetical protein
MPLFPIRRRIAAMAACTRPTSQREVGGERQPWRRVRAPSAACARRLPQCSRSRGASRAPTAAHEDSQRAARLAQGPAAGGEVSARSCVGRRRGQRDVAGVDEVNAMWPASGSHGGAYEQDPTSSLRAGPARRHGWRARPVKSRADGERGWNWRCWRAGSARARSASGACARARPASGGRQGRDGPTAMETTRFLPTPKGAFLRASLLAWTSFLREETVSTISLLFLH